MQKLTNDSVSFSHAPPTSPTSPTSLTSPTSPTSPPSLPPTPFYNTVVLPAVVLIDENLFHVHALCPSGLCTVDHRSCSNNNGRRTNHDNCSTYHKHRTNNMHEPARLRLGWCTVLHGKERLRRMLPVHVLSRSAESSRRLPGALRW